jgi:hypothetical protein
MKTLHTTVESMINYLSFRDYVLVSQVELALLNINLVAFSKEGLMNIVEDINLLEIRFSLGFFRLDMFNNLVVVLLSFPDIEKKLIINICYVKEVNILKDLVGLLELEFEKTYYDGNKMYYFSQALECIKTKFISNELLKCDPSKIIALVNLGYIFTAGFWKTKEDFLVPCRIKDLKLIKDLKKPFVINRDDIKSYYFTDFPFYHRQEKTVIRLGMLLAMCNYETQFIDMCKRSYDSGKSAKGFAKHDEYKKHLIDHINNFILYNPLTNMLPFV